MSDEHPMHMGMATNTVQADNPREMAGAMGMAFRAASWLFKSGFTSAFTMLGEVYMFFHPAPKKLRFHWMHYMAWSTYAVAYIMAISQWILKLQAASGWWSHIDSVGTFCVWFIGSFTVAGLLVKVIKVLEDICIATGTWLAWFPGLGFKTKSGFKPMPWQKVIGWLPQLGPKQEHQKLFSISIKRNVAAETVAVSEAKAAAPKYLPPAQKLAFLHGPANLNETVLRGTKVIDGYEYRQGLEADAKARGEGGLNHQLVTFGAVPMSFDSEPQHLMISGKTGAGKSQGINAIMRTARELRNNAALIADPTGGYLARFGRDSDCVLNPFDVRTENWSPFAEIRYDYDCSTIARATIPDGEGSSGEWNHYAQSLLAEVLKALWLKGEKDATRVLYFCASAPPEELQALLIGTPAAILTQKSNDRMLGNVRGIISTYMSSWQYLKTGGNFSVRKFVRESDNNGGAWLFMTYADEQMSMLKFLIATWMELAIIEGLSLTESRTRRLWVVLDELDSLGKITSLKAGLTKLRKYGVCCVCGIQTIAQLRANYGRDDAQTLLSCMATKLILSPGDNETADYMSKELGEQEIERVQKSEGESQKLGFGEFDRNVNTNQHLHRQTQPAVMASQLASLPNLQGYLRMPGTDVFQVVIPHVAMPDINIPIEAVA